MGKGAVMPNWVHNEITVRGGENELHVLFSKLTAANELTGLGKDEFTFHNIISPENIEAYLSPEPDNPDGWYWWNIRNWGTKWDACEILHFRGNGSFRLSFDTAWSPPQPIINWLVSYCQPNHLDLTWSYEEEQGWGGEFTVRRGVARQTFYDIPLCHKDYADRAKEGECVCSWDADNVENWFDDCPNRDIALLAKLNKSEGAEV